MKALAWIGIATGALGFGSLLSLWYAEYPTPWAAAIWPVLVAWEWLDRLRTINAAS